MWNKIRWFTWKLHYRHLKIIVKSINDNDHKATITVGDIFNIYNLDEPNKPFIELKLITNNTLVVTCNPFKFDKDWRGNVKEKD